MNNFFEQLKNEGQNIRLSAAEKSAMKARILGVQSAVPAPLPSPYVSHAFSLSIYFRGVVAALLVVVLIGSGTAYAAEGSLPGEPLYALKINVNEKVQAALASTPAAKIEVHAALAERRVVEAETLAARGALDESTSEHLAVNFEEHARIVASSTLALAQSDPDEADQVEIKFNSSIKAHGEILAQLSFGTTTMFEGGEDKRGIARAVLAVANRDRESNEGGQTFALASATSLAATDTSATGSSVVALRAKTPSTLAAPAPDASNTENQKIGGNSGAQRTAALFEEKASSTIKEAQEKYQALKPTLSAETTARLDARFASVARLMSRASAELGAGDYEGAQKDFTQALRAATELSAYLSAQQKFEKQNILPQLLRNSDDNDRNESEGEAAAAADVTITVPLPTLDL